jgi:hypothetical protein
LEIGILPSSFDERTLDANSGLNMMSSTVKDAARLAEVSTATVSRVSNGIDNVSGKTRDKSWLQFQNCSIVPTRTQPN